MRFQKWIKTIEIVKPKNVYVNVYLRGARRMQSPWIVKSSFSLDVRPFSSRFKPAHFIRSTIEFVRYEYIIEKSTRSKCGPPLRRPIVEIRWCRRRDGGRAYKRREDVQKMIQNGGHQSRWRELSNDWLSRRIARLRFIFVSTFYSAFYVDRASYVPHDSKTANYGILGKLTLNRIRAEIRRPSTASDSVVRRRWFDYSKCNTANKRYL